MIKHFYSYHVEIESLEIEINSLDIDEKEKKHLISLAESHIHNSVIDNILSELSKADKKIFIEHINGRDHEKIWSFLHSKLDNVEDKIVKAAAAIKKELHKDIKEARS